MKTTRKHALAAMTVAIAVGIASGVTAQSGSEVRGAASPFILVNVPPVVAAQVDEYALSQPEVSELASTSASATTYVVDGIVSDLRKHIGHRLAVTGMIGTGASPADDYSGINTVTITGCLQFAPGFDPKEGYGPSANAASVSRAATTGGSAWRNDFTTDEYYDPQPVKTSGTKAGPEHIRVTSFSTISSECPGSGR